MTDRGKELRDRISTVQQRFCEEYAGGANITNAAKEAGYSPRTANKQGSRLLKNVDILAYVDHLRREHETNKTLSRQRMREILRDVAEGEIPETKVSDRVNAIKQDAVMTGNNAPTKIEGEFSIHDILNDLPRTTGLPNDNDES